MPPRLLNLSSGISYCDLNFVAVPQIIATAILHGPGGVALIDPGPASTLPTLEHSLTEAGISMADVRAVILTHIHLDHAGATGTLVHRHPSLRVYVHEVGARHMVEPERLVASATRLYGADMDRLWGEIRPVPRDAIVALSGGERIAAGGRELDVIYTPGHASHHVSYVCEAAGIAFVGDTAGVRRGSPGFVLPPTPPPDIDLEIWRDSLRHIGERRTETLFVTHFGPYAPAAPHLAEMLDHLELVSGLVKTSLGREGSDEDREGWFTKQVRAALRRRLSDADAHAYEVAGRFDLNWRGLARYWRKRS